MRGRLRCSTLGSSQRVVIATMCSMVVMMGAETVPAITTAEAAAAEIATKCCPTAVVSPSPGTDAKIKRFVDFTINDF